MRCPIRRASARLAQTQNSGGGGEDANATSSQPVEEPPVPADVPQDELMTALSDDLDEYVSQDYDSGNSGDILNADSPSETDNSLSEQEGLLCPHGDCATAATAHLNAGRFDKAILAYTSALKGHNTDNFTVENQIQLLLGRCEAYCSLSRHLRTIPAAQSERRAVYAPDPHSLASSALRDAEHAFSLESSRAGAVHKARGDALFLLERYSDAREAYSLAYAHTPGACLNAKMISCEQALCEGLTAATGGEPSSSGGGGGGGGVGGVHSYAAIGAGTGPAGAAGSTPPMSCTARLLAIKQQALQDSECTLCLKLLYEPVTTPCGHTFCSPCLARSYDHANKCPMCRTVLHVGQLPVSIVLKNILERSFPEEYEQRKCEEISAASLTINGDGDGGSGAGGGRNGVVGGVGGTGSGGIGNGTRTLPLFVMSPMLPGERMAINIFEPRYRLMLRRVMAGSRHFGMATVNSDHSLHDVCCEVEVTECEPLADGRYYIEVVGRRRFRPSDAQEQDGYRIARAEYFADDIPEKESPQGIELENLATEVEVMADAWMGRMRRLGQSRRAAAELLRRVEPKPASCENKEKLSFWVANLVAPIIDDVGVKLRMLCMTSTVDRLKLCKGVLQQLQDASLGGCSVM